MQLTRIQVDGFGVLRATDLRFGKGMNLVIGPNEAGKSTLQEAILSGLYGFQSEKARGPAGAAAVERWRPWHDSAFRLALEFELDDGRRLRVDRDFDGETARVQDLETGEDVTAHFLTDGETASLGRRILGIPKDIFTGTACISRAEVMRIEDSGAIREAITALADSAHPDRTARKVLDRLRQERIERVGRPRGRTGPLHLLAARLAELERQLAAARQARSAVEELAQKREAVATLTEAELSVVQTLEAAVLTARFEDARRRLDRVQQIDHMIADENARLQEHAAFSGFPRARDEEVRGLRTRLRATEEAEREFAARAADAASEVAALEAERGKLEQEYQGQIARARGVSPNSLKEEPMVRELVSSLSLMDAQAPEAHLRARTCADEVQHLADRHPGLIGQGAEWTSRHVEFQRVYAEWRERSNAATEARRRAGAELPPRLEQLKQDVSRYKEVPETIKAAQQAEEAMRHEETMAERSRSQYGTWGIVTLVGVLLMAVAFLVMFVGLSVGPLAFIVAAFLLGMGLLGAILGLVLRGAANRQVDRRLRAKDDARLRRREILGPWGVRSSGELQQALVDHLQRIRSDATRLELDRQAAELEERSRAAGRTLRELIGSWGLSQPAPTEDALEGTAQLMQSLAEDDAAWKAAQQRWEEATRTEKALDDRRETLRQRLHGVLDRLGFDRREALAAGQDFLGACEAGRAAQQLRTRIQQLEAQLDQLRQPADRAMAEHEKASQYRAKLEAIYRPAGITEADPEASARRWDDAVAHVDTYVTSNARLKELQDSQIAVAGDQDTAGLARLVGELDGQSQQAQQGLAPGSLEPYRAVPLADLERQLDQHRASKERAQEERARAEELLNDRLLQIGDVASLEEEIVTVQEQLQELEAQAHAYDLAIDTLEEAAKSVRRAVIPQMKAQLQSQLAPITNGRYREVQVMDDLGLQVRTQDHRAFKDVDHLSMGTRSLIYLLQRVALARIISGSTESLPLLLDEALVHADRRRMKAALDELGRLGQEHQILLFSKDETLAERGERAGNWTIIRLPGPSVTSPHSPPDPGRNGDQAESANEEVSA
jgi:DNA repair exonuclease SbcCD ATPase subunit